VKFKRPVDSEVLIMPAQTKQFTWEQSLERGREQSAARGVPVLIDFSAAPV